MTRQQSWISCSCAACQAGIDETPGPASSASCAEEDAGASVQCQIRIAGRPACCGMHTHTDSCSLDKQQTGREEEGWFASQQGLLAAAVLQTISEQDEI